MRSAVDVEIEELEKAIRTDFPPENYGIKNSLEFTEIEIEEVRGRTYVKVERDEAEVKRWWDCWDVSAEAARLTGGDVILTSDTELNLYSNFHFVCNAEIEGGSRCVDGTPLFDFVKSPAKGRAYDSEKKFLVLSVGMAPFSFHRENGSIYHGQLYVNRGPFGGVRGTYHCTLIGGRRVRQLVEATYVKGERGFKKTHEGLFEIEPVAGAPGVTSAHPLTPSEADRGLVKHAQNDSLMAEVFVKGTAKALERWKG